MTGSGPDLLRPARDGPGCRCLRSSWDAIPAPPATALWRRAPPTYAAGHAADHVDVPTAVGALKDPSNSSPTSRGGDPGDPNDGLNTQGLDRHELEGIEYCRPVTHPNVSKGDARHGVPVDRHGLYTAPTLTVSAWLIRMTLGRDPPCDSSRWASAKRSRRVTHPRRASFSVLTP